MATMKKLVRPDVAARPIAFWTGVAAVTAGVILHLPMFFSASDMHYKLAGMPMDTGMVIGMVLIVVGLIVTAYGLYPRREQRQARELAKVSVRPLDDAPLSPAHVILLLVMSLAVVIDVMKPASLGFVVPGMAKEFGLKSAANPHGSVSVALLPLCATIGTVVGSFVWGAFADRIGRRASILLAAVLFIATAICGVMPNYNYNFFMCFMMGAAAGGMLPITFSLISETMPVRHRGWLMVLIGAQFAAAYVLTSWLAGLITPHYSWRMMWLLNLPTGLILVLLNRWIPESARFLIARGRGAEAEAIMKRYGARVFLGAPSELVVEEQVSRRWREILSRSLLSNTVVLLVMGLGIGLVTFGFQLWLPSNLQKLGFAEVTADKFLRDAALIGFPATLLVAAMYGLWSSRKTILLLVVATVASLITFVVMGNDIAHHRSSIYLLLAIPITTTSSLTALVLAYGSEIYPTKLRSRGTGLAAAATKAGGVVVSGLVVATVSPSISTTALLGAIPLSIAAILVLVFGMETRSRGLEEITAEEFGSIGKPLSEGIA